MKIAVIGATGRAGSLIAREALRRGHEVTAIVRDAGKLQQGLMPAIQTDIMAITPDHVRGFDAVVNAYRCAPGQEEEQVTVMRHLIAVFEQAPGVRLLVVGGAASLYTDETLSRQFYENLPPEAKLPIYAAKALDALRPSRIAWTFFSPALKFDPDGPRTGRYTPGGEFIIRNAQGESYISYADYAVAMVDEIENRTFIGKRFTAVGEKAAPAPETEPDGRKRFVYRSSPDLAGKVFYLVMDDGSEYVANFLDGQTVAWAGRGEPFTSQEYRCAKPDSQVYMPSFIIREGDLHTCVTLVLDLEQSLVTMLKANVGLFPARSRLTAHRMVFGAIKQPGKPLPAARHAYTAELVGKRIAWQYSPAVKLTHLYISERYMRGSLKNMPPVADSATAEQRAEIEDRAKRWSALFFEEPCFYVKISKHLYFLGMIEEFRNRVNPQTGGGDLVFVINTEQMQDYIRSIDMGVPYAPSITLHSARGEWISEPDEMETAPSPYRV